jgi:hypothetical protein
MTIEAIDGQVRIYGHGELWLTPVEAFNLASQLIEAAKRAKEQKRDQGVQRS